MERTTDFEGLEYAELIDLLGKVTKQYTSDLVTERKWEIEDDRVYFINLLIKEIELREKKQPGLGNKDCTTNNLQQ